MILSANYGDSTASAAFGFLAVLGVVATIPVGIIYFSLLILVRARRRLKTLINIIRIVDLILFSLFL